MSTQPDWQAVAELKRGDVVAVKLGKPLSAPGMELVRHQLDKVSEQTGIRFLIFEDVDLRVFRPVEP